MVKWDSALIHKESPQMVEVDLTFDSSLDLIVEINSRIVGSDGKIPEIDVQIVEEIDFIGKNVGEASFDAWQELRIRAVEDRSLGCLLSDVSTGHWQHHSEELCVGDSGGRTFAVVSKELLDVLMRLEHSVV